MAIKYYVLGEHLPRLNSGNIKAKCDEIEDFMSKGDDQTINLIKDLCATIVDIDDVTRDKLKGSMLAVEVRAKALPLRATNPP
jgi:hypothetical protein